MSGDTTPGVDDPLLDVENLRTHIETGDRTIHAVDGVSFSVDPGETVCLVGESGSGKTVTCESLTKLVPRPPAELVSGTVEFDGEPLHDAGPDALRTVRGNRIAHIFQNPQQALDPVYTIGDQIVEAIQLHEAVDESAARERAVSLLRRVGIPGAADRLDDYPHEFSGGMAQRAAIAIALAAEPDLLIADEPTTAVDVTVQARLIELLRELTGGGMAMLLITHDFRVVASLADRVLVMFGGTIVERGPTEELFSRPAHPYTQTLFETYDDISRRSDRTAREDVPSNGCRFRTECPYAVEACAGDEQPPFYDVPGATDGTPAGARPPGADGTPEAVSPGTGDTDRAGTDHVVSCVHYAEDGDPSEILARAKRLSSSGGEGDE